MKKNSKENLTKVGYPKSVAYTNLRAELLLPPRKHPAGTNRCLVVDGMNIAYQAYYAYSKLSHKGMSTSILYGFLNILRPIVMQYNPENITVCWDGKKHPKRIELVPGYKSHREKNRDPKQRKKFLKQIERVRRMLYYLGIPQAYNPEVEGDDMIYKVVKYLKNLYRVTIVSADKDFKQLIDHDVDVYHPRTKVIECVFAFPAANYGLEIPQYIDFLCLTGDSSDDIPGYPGVAEGRASKLLNRFYSVKQYLESNEDMAGFVDKEKLRKIYTRNNRVINLALFDRKYNKEAKVMYYKNKRLPKYNDLKYREFCAKYNMKTLVFPKFLEPFKKLTNA